MIVVTNLEGHPRTHEPEGHRRAHHDRTRRSLAGRPSHTLPMPERAAWARRTLAGARGEPRAGFLPGEEQSASGGPVGAFRGNRASARRRGIGERDTELTAPCMAARIR